MKKVSIKDIAEKAGVSIGTVDRVIHNRGRVSQDTREKVLKICREMDYEPNVLAQRLASDKPFVFATFTPKPKRDNSYWQTPLQGILKAADELSGYRVRIKTFFYDQDNEESFRQESLNIMLEKPDGVLIAPLFHREARDLAQKLESYDIPYVFIDSKVEGTNYLSYFGQDSFRSGYLAGRLIWFHIRKKAEVIIINFTSDLENHVHLKNREKGLRQFMENHHFRGTLTSLNIRPKEELVLTHTLYERLHHKTQGLFVTSSAHKVARSLQKIGKDRILFVGYDLTPDNITYLNKNIIDVLLCQKPMAQGHNGIMALFNHLVRKRKVEKDHSMPLEIIVKENYQDYSDL